MQKIILIIIAILLIGLVGFVCFKSWNDMKNLNSTVSYALSLYPPDSPRHDSVLSVCEEQLEMYKNLVSIQNHTLGDCCPCE